MLNLARTREEIEKPKMGHDYSIDDSQMICPYCGKHDDSGDGFEEVFEDSDIDWDQVEYGSRYPCVSDPVIRQCTGSDGCGRHYKVTYKGYVDWFCTEAMPCKSQAHDWYPEPSIINHDDGTETLCYRCTKCAEYLFGKRKDDGSIPTKKEVIKQNSRKYRDRFKDKMKHLPDGKKVSFSPAGNSEYNCPESITLISECEDGNAIIFEQLIKVLKGIGFEISTPEGMKPGENHSCLAKTHRALRWKELEGEAEYHPRSIKIEFWQNVIHSGERPDNNGKYEFNKWELMPYLTKKRVKYTSNKVYEFLTAFKSVQLKLRSPRHMEPDRQHGIGYDWHGYAETGSLKGKALCEWVSSHPYKGNIEPWRANSKTGKGLDSSNILDGDWVYAYKDGRLWHGQFFYRCGTYGWILVGGSEGLLVSEDQCFKHLDKPIKRRWTPKEKRIRKLESVLSKLIESKNFTQCVKIQKQIDINEAMED